MPNSKVKNQNVKIDIDKVAKLANLSLDEQEKKVFTPQLSETIDYIEKLEEINTSVVEPTSQVTDLENVTRDDVAEPSLTKEDALKNANSTYNDFILTEAILEEQ